jgi:hypothetical protein
VAQEPIDGNPVRSEPVFICSEAAPCAAESQQAERTIARSSAQVARCGNSSEISMPDRPCLANLNGEPLILPLDFCVCELVALNECSVAWRRLRSGFGSNVSTWLGPPTMNRKMQLLARGAKWDGVVAEAPRMPSFASRYAIAVPKKPLPAWVRSCRRVTLQGKRKSKGFLGIVAQFMYTNSLVFISTRHSAASALGASFRVAAADLASARNASAASSSFSFGGRQSVRRNR